MSDDAWVLAIDFGTSSTAAAIGRDGGAELVAVDGGLPRMLSNVFLQEPTGKLLLGDVAENSSSLAPWCFERSPKLKLGQRYMLLGNRRVSVTDAVGQVLHKVAADAIRMRGGDRPAVVRLTHPVRWGDRKRAALVAAAESAGLAESLELVLEPVAAAMHYARERLAPGQHVAVYDLGGGTLDTAVLRCTEDGFEVIGEPRGIDGFGGEEFDHRLYLHLGAQLAAEDWARLRAEPERDRDTSWTKANRQFQRNVRRAKELLSHNDAVDIDVPAPVNGSIHLRRDELNALIRADVEESVHELSRSIRSAGLKPSDLVAVYLAGGCGQIPLVSEVIQQRLGVPPQHLNDSKSVICLGAALGRPGPSTGRVTAGAVAGATVPETAGATVLETVGATELDTVGQLLRSTRVAAPTSPHRTPPTPPAPGAGRRRGWTAGIGVAVAVALVAAVIWIMIGGGSAQHPVATADKQVHGKRTQAPIKHPHDPAHTTIKHPHDPTHTTKQPQITRAAIGPCPASALKVSLGRQSLTTGEIDIPVAFVNEGQTTCTLRGYPNVAAVTGGGTRIARPAVRVPTSVAGPIETVRLAPGNAATSLVQIPRTSIFPPARCEPVAAAALTVSPPHQRKAVTLRQSFQTCSAVADTELLDVYPVN